MMSTQKTLTISVLGKTYSLHTDENKEMIEEAAKMVDVLLKKSVSPSTSPSDLAKMTTFVALQIAVNLLKEQDKLKTVNDKAAVLNILLNESLAG